MSHNKPTLNLVNQIEVTTVSVMAKKKAEAPVFEKFTRVYEDDDHKSVWTYDYNKSRTGPVSVEITYKNLPKSETKKKVKKGVKKRGVASVERRVARVHTKDKQKCSTL